MRMFVVADAGETMAPYYRDDVAVDGPMTRYLRATDQPHLPVRPLSEYDGNGDVIEFSCLAHVSKLDPIYEKMKQIDGLKVVYYADTYREGYKFLECGAANGGKGVGAKAAQALAGADKLYVFGDNFNDRPMYEAADKSFAPNTAEPEMQRIASHVIPSHNEGGVIRTICDIFEGRFQA
jgi:hydroxymethylpyrimidine pyrophosphatase-like HAD family hydrolase